MSRSRKPWRPYWEAETPGKALSLQAGDPLADDDLVAMGGDAVVAKWHRLIPFERYVVAVNVIEDGVETMKVLAGYFYTTAAAERARDALAVVYPACAVIATVSMLDSADEQHGYALGRWLGRRTGLHGDGVH